MGATNHLIAPEELMAYLDGELSPDRAADALAHLEHCRDCQAIAADLQGVSRRLMAWEVEVPGSLTLGGVSGALDESRRMQVEHVRKRHLFRNWALGLAAVVVVLFTFAMPRLDNSRMSADMARTHEPHNAMFSAPARQQYAKAAAVPLSASQGRLPHASTGSMIVRRAELTLTTADFDKVRDRIMVVLGRHKGYMAELNIGAPLGAPRTLEATLRVPADQLEAATAELKLLGRVESESQRGEEVTQQYVDLEARLTNAKNTEQRLIDLLRQRTGKLADVLSVEKEIDDVREKIERMEAEKKNLGNRVDFATLSIKVNEDYKAEMQVVPGSFRTRLQNAAVEGYQSATEGLVSVLLAVITYGPTILIWTGLLFFPVRVAWKRWRRAA
jgi:hypothetical protein